MEAIPTDWLETVEVDGVKYGCDSDYNIWNMDAEEKIFHETGTEEIDLLDVIRGEAKWDDAD